MIQCYEIAVKSYMEKPTYEIESQAFQGIREQQGVVQYLGEFRLQRPTIHFPNSPSHHIMLEYGELDLDEYLAETYPPVLNEEIRGFWEEFFSVARTLQNIHHLKYGSRDGNRREYRGQVKVTQGLRLQYTDEPFRWHGDIKPDNILRVQGKYKLADFGFAKFEREREGNTKTYMDGGTRTYGMNLTVSLSRSDLSPERNQSICTNSLGAPECDRKATRTPLSQTIDTWSFGCVLSSVATWVVLGSQAYENFHERRKIAIKALKTKQAKDKRTSVPSCEDAFHDGKNVLSAVTEWHVYLRNSARRADTTTHLVLDLVDKHMLLPSPEQRLMMGQLCEKLEGILVLSDHEHRQNLEKGNLKEIGLDTLNALQELDNQAPSRAAIAQGAGSEVDLRKSDGYGGFLPTFQIDDKSGRPRKARKSERFDKIVLAKTANRVQNSQPMSEISESPGLLPEGTGIGSANPIPGDEPQQEKIPDIRLDSSDFPSVENRSPTRPPQGEPLGVQPYHTASPESIPPGFLGTETSRPNLEHGPIALEHHEKIVQSSLTAAHESLKATWTGALEDPKSAAAGAGASTSGQFGVGYATHDRNEEEASSSSKFSGRERSEQATLSALGRNDPELSTTAIYHELVGLHSNWDDLKKSWRKLKGIPQDPRLKRFISNRDIVRSASIPQPISAQEKKGTNRGLGLCGR